MTAILPALARVCLDDSAQIHLLSVRAILTLPKSVLTRVNRTRLISGNQGMSEQLLVRLTNSSYVNEGYSAIAKVCLDNSEHTHLLSMRAILPLLKSVLSAKLCFSTVNTHLLSCDSEHIHLSPVRAILPLPKSVFMTVNTLTFCLATVNTLIFCP